MFSGGIEMEHGLKWDNVLVGVVSELHVCYWKSKTFIYYSHSNNFMIIKLANHLNFSITQINESLLGID